MVYNPTTGLHVNKPTQPNMEFLLGLNGAADGCGKRQPAAELNIPPNCVEVIDATTLPTQAEIVQIPDSPCSTIVLGDSSQVLRGLPSGEFQTCVTSPPYWSLRNYNIAGQIGLEGSVDAYIARLVEVFECVRNVLRDDGTLWLNIGDSYTSGGRTWRAPDKKNPVRAMDTRPPTPDGLKPKDLIGVPWRLAMALQASGWYLRADIIWNKPNCQPESVRDRPTRSHEYIFLFSKGERYRYNAEAFRGPNGRNVRTVWDINTQAYKDAHFATFPPTLVEPCLTLGSDEGDLVLDPFLGSGTTALVALQLKRRFVGIELNPDYVAIAKRRLNGAIIDRSRQFDSHIGVATDPISPVVGGSEKNLAAGFAF